jgi:phosphate-selective porin
MRRSFASFAVAVLALAAARSAYAQADAPLPAPPPPPDATPSVAVPDVPAAAGTGATSAYPTSDENDYAGWHGGNFFLRSKDDNFRLYVQGRAQIDSYNYAGPGVTDTTLKSTVFLRRIRPELTGEFMKNWQWMLAGDWGATANDGSPQVGQLTTAQTGQIKAIATDVYLNYRCADGLFNVQLGQYDAPFTMENRTSDKYIPFMERSLAVRAVGIPTNKEIGAMFWGELTNKMFFYSLGFFNGDGQGRLSPDNRMDTMGRIFVHPLADSKSPLKDLQIGGSFRYGMRDKNYVNYEYNNAGPGPAGASGFTTQGNFRFWASNYAGAGGRLLHIAPANAQVGYAIELRVPFDQYFEVFGEFVGINNQTREYQDGFPGNSERFGHMKGFAYYVAASIWPMGGRDIQGPMGYENPTHVDLKKADTAPKQALQLLLKWEQMSLDYESADVSGTAESTNIDGKIKVNVVEVGANYWLTKHLRFSFNYLANMFPDSGPTSATNAAAGQSNTWSADQRARAPGNTIGKGNNDDARDSAHMFHEFLFRAAVAF